MEIKEKTVTEVQERVIVRTRIEERPDGTKVTIIDSRKDTDTKKVSEIQKKPAMKDWQIGLTASNPTNIGADTIYGLTLQKRLFLGLSGGLYVRTDKEIGAVLSYSF